jgi:N-acyl homoserine lactone hydrolase
VFNMPNSLPPDLPTPSSTSHRQPTLTRPSRLRRSLAWLCAAPALLGTTACLAFRGALAPPDEVAPPEVPEIVTQRFGAVTVHAVHTGWVRVKAAHRDLHGPIALRTFSILRDRTWTPWMPVTVYVIEHPEGVFLVDAGLSERMLDPEHFACDSGTSFVYRHLLAFRFAPADRIDRRLAQLGIDPLRIRGVVLTHRHADHTDGLAELPASASVYVGEGDWPTQDGALDCHWPKGRSPVLVGRGGPQVEAMLGSKSLTTDGAVRIVPLNGHTPGHLGVWVGLGDASVLFAGDALFDREQLRARRLAGIVADPAHASEALDVIARQLATKPTYLLPAHDPESLARFARRETTRL